MADATSREACIARHATYAIDIGLRLNDFTRGRFAAILAPVRPGDHVLDVGCNSGFIRALLPPGCRVCGVDASVELVAIAATRLDEAHVAPAEALPYPDQSMDVVVLGEILEHVHDPVEVVREARRVARRLVVGSTPHEAGTWGPRGSRPPTGHAYHVRCFTELTLRAALDAGGLRSIRIRPFLKGRTPQMYIFHGVAR